jgi:hypothetical protein
MSHNGRTRGPAADFVVRRYQQRLTRELAAKWRIGANDERVQRISKSFASLTFAVHRDRMIEAFLRAACAYGSDAPTDPGRETVHPLERLDDACLVFAELTQSNPFRAVTGTAYDHLLQYALERTLSSIASAGGDGSHARSWMPRFHHLVDVATRKRTVRALETFLLNYEPRECTAMPLPAGAVRERVEKSAWFPRVLALDLPARAKELVVAYLAIIDGGSRGCSLSDGTYNFMAYRSHAGGRRDGAVDAEYLVSRLEWYVNLVQDSAPEELEAFATAALRACGSSVPLLVMDRLMKVVATDNITEKVREIAYWEEFSREKLTDLLAYSRMNNDYADGARRINATVYTGYVDDLPFAEQIAHLYDRVAGFLRPGDLARHRQMIHHRASEQLKTKEALLRKAGLDPRRATFTADDVTEMLYHGMTPGAIEARRAILQGTVQLLVAPRSGRHDASSTRRDDSPETLAELAALGVEGIWRLLAAPDQRAEPAPPAFFMAASLSPTSRPLIVVTELDPAMSREAKTRQAVFLAAEVVHEYEHCRHHHELKFFRTDHLLRAELRAHAAYHYFLLQQGVPGPWNLMTRTTAQGFGMWQRSLVDRHYLNRPSQVTREAEACDQASER